MKPEGPLHSKEMGATEQHCCHVGGAWDSSVEANRARGGGRGPQAPSDLLRRLAKVTRLPRRAPPDTLGQSARARCRAARAFPSGAADRGRGSRRRGHARPVLRRGRCPQRWCSKVTITRPTSMKTSVGSMHSAAMGGRFSSSTADTASRERSQPRCSCLPSRQLARTRPNG